MRQLSAIFRSTFWEAIRQPIFGLLLMAVAVLILCVPLTGVHIYTLSIGTYAELAAQRSIAEMGLSTVLIAGMLLAVAISSGLITREIDEKTAAMILSKNVGRTTFIIGKFLGVAAAITMAVMSWSMLIMQTVRFSSGIGTWQTFDTLSFVAIIIVVLISLMVATASNYFAGKSWVGNFSLTFFIALSISFIALMFVTADYEFAVSDEKFGAYDWQIAIAALLTLQAILLLCGWAVALSTRLGMAANLMVCFIIFNGGLTIDYFYAHYGDYFLVKMWRVIVPALQAFWMSEALKYEVNIPLSYVALCSGYTLIYLTATFCAAIFLFARREIN